MDVTMAAAGAERVRTSTGVSLLLACLWAMPAALATDWLATGDQALRDHDMATAHAAYGQAVTADPNGSDANLMRAITLLGDLFERPTAGIRDTLDGWQIEYYRSAYGFGRDHVLYVCDFGEGDYHGSWRLDEAVDDYDARRWEVRGQGLPTAADLAGYDAVVWDMGETTAMTPEREALLGACLDAGGHLFLGGGNVLATSSTPFVANRLHIATRQHDTTGAGADLVDGVAGDPISAGVSDLRRDSVGPVTDSFTVGAGATAILTDGSGRRLGLRWSDAGSGSRLVFLSVAPGSFLNRREDVTQQYEVWGGWDAVGSQDVYYPDWYGYDRLGDATGTATFTGSYPYYIIVCSSGDTAARIDTVQGQGAYTGYFGSNTTGNVLDWGRIGGAPDGQAASVNASGWRGGVLIDASAQEVSGIRVHCAAGTTWPWDDPANLDTLVERTLTWFGVPTNLTGPDEVPAGAPTVNSTADAARTDLEARIDQILPLLAKVEANAAADWQRTLTADMFPGEEPEAQTVDRIDALAAAAGLELVKTVLDLVDGYNLNVVYDDVTADDWELTQAYWDSKPDFFTVRTSGRFTSAKASLQSALQKARTVVTRLQAHPATGGRLASADVADQDLADVLGYLDDVLASLAADTVIDFDGHDPLTVNLGKLFSAPITRADMPESKPSTRAGEEIDWETLPDPTFNGVFPGWTRAHVYARLTDLFSRFEASPGWATSVLLRPGHHPVVRWGDYDWEIGGNPPPQEPTQFDEYITRFEVWRATSTADAGTRVANLSRDTIGEWAYTDTAAPADAGELDYYVRVFFRAGNNTSASFRTDWVSFYADSDSDGLADDWERLHFESLAYGAGTDDDHDGLSNGREYQLGTRPNDDDSDDDGLTDGLEVQHEYDPLDPADAAADDDEDGMPNGWEIRHGLGPDSADAADNPDGDALSNLQEYRAGTDPRVFDTIDILPLRAGWNLVSIPYNTETPTVAAVFAGKVVGTVWAWDAATQRYEDAAAVRGNLSDKQGYWVYVDVDTDLVVRVTGPQR